MQTVNYQRLLKGCMWLAVAVGAYSRLHGLGTWPLAVDEYFIAQSADNILQHGIPAFNCGGYYMRGLTLQYLIAPLRELGLSAELAGRLVTAACSFAVLPAVYLLGKRLSGVTVACVGVALLSLSLWEIEFARFARMYMPFQAIFLWYLLAMHRVVVDRRPSAYGWMWLLSIVGLFTWEGGLFLLVTNFVPSLIERAPYRARNVAASAGLLLFGIFYRSLDFRFMGSQPAFPAGASVPIAGSHFLMPSLLASTLSTHPVWQVAALAILAIGLWAVIRLMRASGTMRERLVWIVLIALSLLNLFGGVVLGSILALFVGWIDWRRGSRQCLRIAVVPILASFGFWLAYALLTDAGHQLHPSFGPGGELSKLAVLLLKYPNVFNSILFRWFHVTPALTIALSGLLGLAIAWAVWAKDNERSRSLRLILVVCLLMAAMVGVVNTQYIRTRYTFFLLPVLYLVGIAAIHALFVRPIRSRPKRGLVLGLALLALCGLTEDFGWAHLMHMDSAVWNYRLHLNKSLAEHYYTREDFRTPAEFVNLRAHPDDLVIVVPPLASIDYLNRTDYVYWNFRWHEFASISCDRGQRERWSGNRLLYRRQDLLNVIDKAPDNVWLIATAPPWDSPLANVLRQRYLVTPLYRGLAGRLAVYKIDNIPLGVTRNGVR